MSIIYDALQKTQKNLENKRDANVRKKIQWLDKIIFIVIAGLLIVNLFVYYPHFFKNSPSSLPVKKPSVILKPASSTQMVTQAVVKPIANVSVANPPVPIKSQSPIVLAPSQPVIKAPLSTKIQSEQHPSAEELLLNPNPKQKNVAEEAEEDVIPESPIEPALNQSSNLSQSIMQTPRAPLAANEKSYQGKLVLNGVFLSDQESIALINNQAFHMGDLVDGLKIVAIEADTVKLQNDKGIFVLRTVT